MSLNINTISPFICLDCIAGSKAYGLDTPASDDDFKGVFLAPLPLVLTGQAPSLVQDEKHDRQYTELGAFCRELELNNSGALELLACIGGGQELFCAPWLREFLGRYQFLSRRCYYTYMANAQRQLKRISATHSKAVEPPPAPAAMQDYAFVVQGASLRPLGPWLAEQGLGFCDVAARRLADDENLYALYRQSSRFGLFGRDATTISTPAIAPDAPLLGLMLFRAEAYSRQNRRCVQYREWEQKRNPGRLVTDASLAGAQGNYDTKHMGHVFRLLHTAREIATEGVIQVHRTHDNAFLRDIRAGRIPLAELQALVAEEMAALKPLFDRSDLPETPRIDGLWEELAQLRIRLHHE